MNCKRTIQFFFIALLFIFHQREANAGRSRPAIRGVTAPPSSAPPSSSTLPPTYLAPGGYSRFHANDSLIGRAVPCTDDEKICFRFNRIFDPKTNTCQPIGGGFDPGCNMMPNRTEFERGSGRLVGACKKYHDPCPGYRMAHDGRCYRKELVRDVICGCRAEPTRHFLGGAECRCSARPAARVEQPTKKGLCRVPDLRFPSNLSSSFKLRAPKNVTNGSPSPLSRMDSSRPSCSSEQKKCFSIGEVWVSWKKNCFPLLRRGPCAKDHVVAMPREAWMSAECRHGNGGCLPGQIRMAFDGQCHDAREMALTAPGWIVLDIFGEYIVVNRSEVISYTPAVFNDACVIFSGSSMPRPPPRVVYPKPPCGSGKDDLCFLYKVFNEAPTREARNYTDNEV